MITVSVIASFVLSRTLYEVKFVESKVHLDSIVRSGNKKTRPLLHERASKGATEKSLSPIERIIK